MSNETFPPARSALNLRLVLAGGGALMCAVLGVVALNTVGAVLGVPLLLLAVVGLVDLVVILRRRRERSREHRGRDHQHDSLFE